MSSGKPVEMSFRTATGGEDPELDAIDMILLILKPFSIGVRARILEYVDKRASDSASAPLGPK
jgi:hypothetical protein